MNKPFVLTAECPAARTDSAFRIMALACLIVFMAQMSTTVYLPSLPVVMQDLHMTQGAVELSISAFVFGSALPLLFWGTVAERWGRRGPLLVSLALFLVMSLLLSMCASAFMLLALRFIQGVAGGGCAIVARIVVRDNWTGDELARRLSVLSIAFVSALGGGQFIGGVISQYGHWQTGFLLMAVTAALAILLTVSVPMRSGQSHATTQGEKTRYRTIIGRPRFVWPACVGGLGFATTVTLQQVSPFVFQTHFHLAVTHFGCIGLLFGLSYFFGAMLVNRFVRQIGAHGLMRIGSGVLALAGGTIMVLWYADLLKNHDGMLVFIALYCLAVLGQAILFPNSMALAVSEVREQGAQAMALCGFLQQGLAGLAATLAVLLQNGGRWTLAVCLLSFMAFLLVRFKPDTA
jgi:MFS family permease